MADAIDAAIEAVTPAPQQTVEMIQVQIPLAPHGRPLILAVPRDITIEEAYNALTAIPAAVAQLRAQNPTSRLVGPQGQAIG